MTRLLFRRTALLLVACAGLMLSSLPVWCQEETPPTDTGGGSGDDAVRVPPPVSGQNYPTEFSGDTEENYLRGGFTLSSAYASNVTGTSRPIGDMSYSFWPTIAVDKVTPQLHILLSYSPGFTIYQKTSGYNQANQNVNLNLQYRISPRLSISVQEGFNKSSSIFDQPNPLAASPVSGSPPVIGLGVVAPLADQISNTTSAQLAYQLGEASFIGISGTFGNQHYLDSQQSSELYNTRSTNGSLYYSRRLREKYYVGVNYQYQDILSYQTNSPSTPAQIQTVFAFLSIFLKPTVSISVSGGPQHYAGTQPPFSPVSSWSPLLTVSGSWQGQRTTVAASYSRTVSGAGGLNGIFHSTAVGTSVNWKVSRNWSAAVGATYADNQSLTPLFFSSGGGRSVVGTVSAHRTLGEHTNVQFGYNWTNQTYEQTAAASIPNTNRVFVSLSYQFTRPLQRY